MTFSVAYFVYDAISQSLPQIWVYVGCDESRVGCPITFLSKGHTECLSSIYRVIQGSWLKGGTLYIWYRWAYPEILLGGGSHKLFFLFGVS